MVESLKTKRSYAAIALGAFAWTLGVFSALSFNLMSEFKIFGMNFFDFTDFLTNQIMLPLGGIFIAIFVGWVMKKQDVLDELQIEDGIIFKCWFFVLRFVAPVMVGMVLWFWFFLFTIAGCGGCQLPS